MGLGFFWIKLKFIHLLIMYAGNINRILFKVDWLFLGLMFLKLWTGFEQFRIFLKDSAWLYFQKHVYHNTVLSLYSLGLKAIVSNKA